MRLNSVKMENSSGGMIGKKVVGKKLWGKMRKI